MSAGGDVNYLTITKGRVQRMAGKYEVYTDAKGEHRFRLVASNGQNILASEGYSSKDACEAGIASVQKNAADLDQYERKESKDGKQYFVLKAKNHQVIAQSQMYDSVDSMENGIRSVAENGPTATVQEA